MTAHKELQIWLEENTPEKVVTDYVRFLEQIEFVMYVLPDILFSSYVEAKQHPCIVISTNRVNGINQPVYQYKLPSGIVITMLNNFYEWQISVSSPKEIEMDVMELCYPEDTISYWPPEFPQELVYGSYWVNKERFSIKLYNSYQVYTFFWILGTAMGLRKQ